jgi:hypothetical protein
MTHPGVEGGARIPATAVPHYEGNGWQRAEPPAKPARPTKTVVTVVEEQPPPPEPKAEPKKAPARRDTKEN